MYFKITHILLLSLSWLFRGFSVLFKTSLLSLVWVAICVSTTPLFTSSGICKDGVLHVVNVVLRLPFVLALIRLVRQEFDFLTWGNYTFNFFLFLFFLLLFSSSFICRQRVALRPSSGTTPRFGRNLGSGPRIASWRFLLFCGFLKKVTIAFCLNCWFGRLFLVGAVTLLTVALMTVGFFLDRYHWIIQPRVLAIPLLRWHKPVTFFIFAGWTEKLWIWVGTAVGTTKEFSEDVFGKGIGILIERLSKHHTVTSCKERVGDILSALAQIVAKNGIGIGKLLSKWVGI